MSADVPALPTREAIESWAGAGRVVRAAPPDVAAWKLPGPDRDALISCGVPLVDGLVEAVSLHADPTMYRLATNQLDDADLGCRYGAVPRTGEVIEVRIAGGATRFVNSSVRHWLCSLHLVGTWLATSAAVARWEEDEDAEESAIAESAALRERIAALDPPACGAGDHRTHFWPAVLDRWLY